MVKNKQSNLIASVKMIKIGVINKLNCIRNRLLRVSFIEVFDFIIYQHLNKRTNTLPLATSQIAHLCHQFNLVCTASFYATF